MSLSNRALFYAHFIFTFFTLDSMGLTRIDHLGYRPVNNTLPEQKQWNQNSQSQLNIAATPNPYQGWSGAQPLSANVNQWNRYNNTNHAGYNGYHNPNISLTNQWLPHQNNNTPTYAGSYNPALPGWNSQQQTHFPNTTNNWQQPNQNHLYPQLPQPGSGWAGAQPQTTPANYNSNRWNNTHARWNNTFLPSQPQYPSNAGGFRNQPNWPNAQNQTWTNVPTVTPAINPNFSKVPQNHPASNFPNQTAGLNWYNRPNATNNNYGWGNNPAQNTWGAANSNNAQKNWRNAPTNAGGDNGWSNGAQENWRGANNNNNNNNDMRNNNWSYPGRDNSGIQGNSGAPLAPIGSGTSTSGGVPLAPIGGNNAPNSWNAVGNNSPQLAPLAPIAYGVNDPNDPSKRGNTNPYARMFN